MAHCRVAHLMADVEWDARNVLLTLARARAIYLGDTLEQCLFRI